MLPAGFRGVEGVGIGHRAHTGIDRLNIGQGNIQPRKARLHAAQQEMDLVRRRARFSVERLVLVNIGRADEHHALPGNAEHRTAIFRMEETDHLPQSQPPTGKDQMTATHGPQPGRRVHVCTQVVGPRAGSVDDRSRSHCSGLPRFPVLQVCARHLPVVVAQQADGGGVVEGDGSSLRKARKFGPQYRNDFPDLLKKWPKRQTAGGIAWRVPAKRIIENGCNLTLASLGLVEPEKTDHAEPEDILASVAEKERRILALVEEMKALLETGA